MAKSNLKFLLVALTTTRAVEGQDKPARVRFKAKSTVDLTDEELQTLDDLTLSTGKLHYREPVNEGGRAQADEPEVVVVPDYAGQDVALNKKNVDQLKAYLDHFEVTYAPDANKADLLAAAEKHAADPDGGL